MFGKIAAFEFRYQIRQPIFWVAVIAFSLLSFGAIASEFIQIGFGSNVKVNGPWAVAQTFSIFGLLYIFIATAFVANVVVRDDETGYGPLILTTRISKFDYLYGRFAGAFAAACLSFLAVPFGFILGSMMPWVDRETLGPIFASHYLYTLAVLSLPMLFTTCAILFAIATASRSMMWTYVGVVALIILRIVLLVMASRLEMREVGVLWDPFGTAAYGDVTRYWTIAERNSLTPAITGLFLWNKLIWIAIPILFLAAAFPLFRFQTGRLSGRRLKAFKLQAKAAPTGPPPPPLTALPRPTFGRATAWAQLWARTRLDMGQVFGSPAYFVLLAIGVLFAGWQLWLVTNNGDYGGVVYPVTRLMLNRLTTSFTIIPLIIALYYAGELVWREREKKTHELIGATAVADWAFVLPKVLAISLVLISTLIGGAVVAMLVQVFKGYFDFELGKTLVWLILPQSLDFILLAVLAIFFQAISPNKFAGWGLMVLYMITTFTFASLGLEHNLYNYGGAPQVTASDMNGLGKFWIGAWWFRLYWSFFAVVLVTLSYAVWQRGAEGRLWPRLQRAPRRLSGKVGLVVLVALVGFAATGGYIFLNTNVWNEYRTTKDVERWMGDYERVLIKERHFDKVPQPKIQSMKLDVDLRPHQPMLRVTGTYVIKNMTAEDLKEIHVRFDRDLQVKGLSIQGAWPKETLARFNYRIFALDKPMKPGDELTMSFITERSQKGFKNSGDESRVVDNGTFVNSMEFAPALGIWGGGGLQDRAKRVKAGLDPEVPVARLGDVPSRQFNYLRHDADFMSSDITVTTEADQTPIAPGRRISDRIIDTPTGKRRQAHFVTSAPVLPFFSIQSARYAIKRQTYKGIELEIYYAPEHAYNIDRMFTAMKTSLDYYQANFSPYQFDHLRFIEFPAYADFAQAFAGTMPWSENLFFIADYSDPEKIDMVTYVGAHEIGHQWWAHQVIAADQEGMTMTSETLAQYSALRVMKKLYGEDQIRKFLKYELNSYLRARGGQALEEKPMVRVEGSQGYVHYRKGSLVMYRLAEEIGEDKVNDALAQFLKDHAFKGAPYPISTDLVTLFRERAPADKQALITDLFEKITLYDVKVTDAKVTARKDGRFDVTMTVDAKKLYADGKGKETASPMNELLDIGVFTQQPGKQGFGRASILMLERKPIHSGRQTLTYTVAKKPVWVGADPYNILIDRNSDDNLFKIGS
ncbi:MAG: aminopeptidase [Caulobacter sp.]|nr:aminopeptidase [Caulobacter sp.]